MLHSTVGAAPKFRERAFLNAKLNCQLVTRRAQGRLPVDYERRKLLIQRCKAEANPLATLEEFFEGNDDKASIGCNLVKRHPGLATFYTVLRLIRGQSEVQDVLVALTDYEENGDSWPFSDAVYIFTSATKAQVQNWVEPLQSDEVVEVSSIVARQSETRVWMAWWD